MSWTRTVTIPPGLELTRSNAVAGPGESRAVTTAYAGLAASVVAVPLVLIMPIVTPGAWPALAGAFLLVCVSPGAALMCWFDTGVGALQAGLTLAVSLTATAIASSFMIWVPFWHPKLLCAFALVSAVSCGIRLGSARTSAVPWNLPKNRQGLWVQLALLFVGVAAWGYGVSKIRPQSIGLYGLLASANIWFVLGLVALLAGGLLELTRREPRWWLLGTYLVALIVAIHGTLPILFGNVPEYAWVYKHVGIIESFVHYGRVTDPSNIYDQWPALFTTVASVSALAHTGPLAFAAWAPMAFELGDALLLLGIFQMLSVDRRVAYLALFLYEGLIAWVGQDYLSPQAFGYLLWLAIVAILIRWLRIPPPARGQGGILTRLRAPFLAGLPTPPQATRTERRLAWALIIAIYFAIVAAHQLTPYLALASVGALVLFGLLSRGVVLLAVLIVIAGGYLGIHYDLISQQFGGLFSGGNALENASGVSVVSRGAELFTAKFVRVLAGGMWLFTVVVIARKWRKLGLVATPALLAFSPFLIVFAQSYGGEAIYRVYMFSSPWCAILIAGALMELRAPALRWLMVTGATALTLAAGLQGLYGAVAVDAFSRPELTASLWLYGHAPRGSLLILAADNFPDLEVGNYNDYNLQVMPSDPMELPAYLDEGNKQAVDKWITSLGYDTAYLVISQSMTEYTDYFGGPHGYSKLVSTIGGESGVSTVYRNADTTIYRVKINAQST
jgi:hypothetical protein